jgi:hypothetical protein
MPVTRPISPVIGRAVIFPDVRTRSICAICHELIVSTLNYKAYESTQSIRKRLIFQMHTKKLALDNPVIMFQVAKGVDDLNDRIYR